MTTSPTVAVASHDLRCSIQTLSGGRDPIGTAVAYDAAIMVEVALPWPADITAMAVLADVVAVAERSPLNVSVFGVVPDHGDRDRHRIIVQRRDAGPFRRFVRHEALCATADLGTTAAALLAGEVAPLATEPDVAADVFVCTHGRRDRCCGSFGMNLYTELGARSTPALRTWRVSHTGGHRFAPTAILFPEGTAWAWLEADLVDRIAGRRGDLDEVLQHYRGSSAIGGAPAQVVEREAFRREGWSWLDGRRSATAVSEGDNRFVVRLDVERADGTHGRYDAVVERVGTVPQPICGELLDGVGNGKSDAVWSLREFDAVDP